MTTNAAILNDYRPASATFTPDQMALINAIVANAVTQAVAAANARAHHGRTSRAAADVPGAIAFPDCAQPSTPAPNGKVDPIRAKEDIVRMAAYLRDQPTPHADRNYLFFMMGVNVGLRAGDLLTLRFRDVMAPDGSVRELIGASGSVREQKTGKHRRQWINAAARNAILYYVDRHRNWRPDDYLFASAKGTNRPINRRSMSGILKPAAEALHIPGNINTHSMRKSWAYHYFMDNQQTPEALAYLQDAMNHSTSAMTLHYIGLADDRKRTMFLNNCLGA